MWSWRKLSVTWGAVGLLALAASLSAAGLIIMIGRKKGEEED